MKINIVFIFLIVVAATVCQAQIPDTVWTRTYGGTGFETCSSLQQTLDGGFIIGGATTSYSGGYSDFYIIKTNAYGDTAWTRVYGRSRSDNCLAVLEASDGGYLFAGSESMNDLLVRTDAFGDTLWTKVYGAYALHSVQETFDGGYILVGRCSSGAYLLRIDADGDSLWSRGILGVGSLAAKFNSVLQTIDGGFIICGQHAINGAYYPWIVHTDADGDTLWTRTFDFPASDFTSIMQTSDDEYVASGSNSDAAVLVKVDLNGDSLWTRSFEGLVSNAASQSIDQGFMLAGKSLSGGTNGLLMYVDMNGDSVTSWTISRNDFSVFYAIGTTRDGGHIVGGYTYSSGYDSWVVRIGNSSPEIKSIADVVDDQGRSIHLTWDRALCDGDWGDQAVTDYAIYRRVEEGYVIGNPNRLMSENLDWPPGEWDFVRTVPAFEEDDYTATVETLGDSTSEGIHWSTFFVRAMTGYPGIYFDSPIDSGYSVDNLVPEATLITAGLQIVGSNIVLRWDEVTTGGGGQPELNGIWYRVHGDTLPEFLPNSGNLLETTQQLSFTHPIAEDEFYFKVLVSDDH